MSMNDPLANVLSHINNCEKTGKIDCTVRPSSKIIIKVLNIMKDHDYIKDMTITEDGKGNIIKVGLLGNINQCNVIKPRLSFKIHNMEKFEKRFLLARDFGILIVSTPKGIMTHLEAKDKKIGGRLIAYVY
ncbi:30S ribosomal protein S8 [Candidatus Woesearchaeota archaeon]|nr:30S ribosomal protein S8 [Candidatus Woesearchaeota archaeon]